MNLMWTEYGWEDYLYWQATDKKILQRINALIKDIKRSPFAGIGKPEALKFELVGKWSRRINDEHRVVYEIKENERTISKQYIVVYQCRYHYR